MKSINKTRALLLVGASFLTISCGKIFGPMHASKDYDGSSQLDSEATLVWGAADNPPTTPFNSDLAQSEIDLKNAEPTTSQYGPEWDHYFELSQTNISEVQRHNELIEELEEKGEVELTPGKYRFSLESFCMDSSEHAPDSHDGMNITQNFPEDKEWLPIFLLNYKKVGIGQSAAQRILWSLRDHHNFSILAQPEKELLLKIFPDAATRFSASTSGATAPEQ